MPGTLKRTRRRELVLSPSFLNTMKTTVYGTRLPTHRRRVESDRWSSKSRDSRRCGKPQPTRPKSLTQHPVLTLPDEILVDIFLLATHSDPMAPVSISGVCAHWRYLAVHASPILWRRVLVDHRTAMWAERIARAKRCSLDVDFSTRIWPLDARCVQLHTHAVTPFIRRWRSLRIRLDERAYAPLLWNALLSPCCGDSARVEAPRLEALTLCFPRNDDSKEFALFNGVAPRLRTLRVQGLRLAWTPSLYERLTYLDLTFHGFTRGNAAVAEVAEMLSVSRSVRELHIMFPDERPKTAQADHDHRSGDLCGIVPLQHLQILRVRVCGRDVPSEVIQLLAMLSMPVITTFHLVDLGRPGRPFRALPAFLPAVHHISTLDSLHAEGRWCSQRFILGLSYTSPGLRKLQIVGPAVPQGLLREIARLRNADVQARSEVTPGGISTSIIMTGRVRRG